MFIIICVSHNRLIILCYIDLSVYSSDTLRDRRLNVLRYRNEDEEEDAMLSNYFLIL